MLGMVQTIESCWCHAFLWNEDYVVHHLSSLAHNFTFLAESSLDANPQVKFAWWVLGGFLFVFFPPASHSMSSAVPFYHFYDRNSYLTSISQNSQMKFCVT